MAKKIYDCMVIGGGAAGMMAAITAARDGKSVLLLEKNDKPGVKLLQTGNGRCNFTNYDMSEDRFNNDDKEFVKTALALFNENDTIGFFKSVGVFPKDRNGYVYPHSETAVSLRDALAAELYDCGVEVVIGSSVSDITKKNGIFTTDNGFQVVRVIIAAGSKAAPKTGSDGSGYVLARKLSHSIAEPLPALVQLTSDNKGCKVAAGVRSTAALTLNCGGVEYTELGEVQFTDYGLSGIPVFQLSHHAVKAVNSGMKVYITVDMIPDYSADELTEYVLTHCDKTSKTTEQLFSGILNRKLVAMACKSRNIAADMPVTSGNMKSIRMLIGAMKAYRFNITGYKDFENAQVCQGGVRLSEINPQTMESKLCEGLFFAGEIMDVDGICGGYNLQWAWTSGYIAGKNAAGR